MVPIIRTIETALGKGQAEAYGKPKKKTVKSEADRPVSIFDAVILPLIVDTNSARFDRSDDGFDRP